MIQKLAIKTVTPIAAALFFFTATSNAETWVRCDACSLSQSEALAVAVGPEQDVVVFNARDRIAHAFWTQTQVTGSGCQPLRPGQSANQQRALIKNQNLIAAAQCSHNTIATQVALDPSKENLLSAIHNFYIETNGTMQKSVNINIADIPNAPTEPGPIVNDPRGLTAYDIQNNNGSYGAFSRAVTAYLETPAGQTQVLLAGIISQYHINFAGTEFVISVQITLADGSTVTLKYTLDDEDPALVSAKDPNGEAVFEAGSAPIRILGDHAFVDSQNIVNFLNNARLNGIRITDGGIGGNSASCHSTIKPDGEVIVTCTRN